MAEPILPSRSVSLNGRDIRRSYTTSTLLLEPSTAVSVTERFCYPYPGIELDDDSIVVETNVLRWPRLFDLHQQTLEEFIGQTQLQWMEKVDLIEMLLRALKHSKKFDRPHGHLDVDCISISSDGRNRPFIWKVESKRPKTSDLKSFGKIIYCILTNGETYNGTVDKDKLTKCLRQGYDPEFARIASTEPVETAFDLILSMVDGDSSFTAVAAHPFFWSDKEKSTFVSDLFESVGLDSKKFPTIKELFDCDNGEEDGSDVEQSLKLDLFGGDWIKKLKLLPTEKTALHKRVKCQVNMDLLLTKAQPKGFGIEQYVIKGNALTLIKVVGMDKKKWKSLLKNSMKDTGQFQDLETENEWMQDKDQCAILENVVYKKNPKQGYDEGRIYDLVRFIRNRKVHCYECEKDKDNLEIEYYEKLGGYWNFYSARFPKLLVVLYKHQNLFPFYKGLWETAQ